MTEWQHSINAILLSGYCSGFGCKKYNRKMAFQFLLGHAAQIVYFYIPITRWNIVAHYCQIFILYTQVKRGH